MADAGNISQVQSVQMGGLRIVGTVPEGGKLIVTVEGDSISKLIDGAARRLAYDERLKHGMVQSGIEAVGGTYVPDEEVTRAKEQGRNIMLWRADFRLTPMI